MKPGKTITRAWCVELQQELSITAARREYFSQEPPRQRFEFLCSSEACRAQGVKVTGVRYDVKPQDNPTFVAAHFRANPHYQHQPDCEWVEEDEAVDEPDEASSDPQQRLRQARRKLDDNIDVFDPTLRQAVKEPALTAPAGHAAAPREAAPVDALKEPAAPRYSETRTSNLERLVDFYRQARAELPEDDFKQLTLRVAGQGEVALRSYFRHIKYAQPGENQRVLYGGGLLDDKRYGKGFKFQFFDRLEGKRVTLYVSPAQMQAYRSSRYIEELLSHAGEVKFFTLYALGKLVQSPSGKSFSLEVDDLRHLAIVLGPPKDGDAAP
ncbi:ATPase [Pseudomonas sp. DTU_2021_1001937_2_SI_NGA_ILE_001]|uniref:ATPase n=1 Tax=Pseudomonas sp. DTU_2021_1001937_2_SI_NGA_ILE_001 TaxID=3077589 RepID=UPI0025F98261|nr:ATPase [Pseudomonas sp. DTU_2021_1001937_2_SI_NGA_ILE_001]WNW13632.1 ATPase [Pseudomonas sp. DTU_2021_1001937_2_SI_NGA_ILE_001]